MPSQSIGIVLLPDTQTADMLAEMSRVNGLSGPNQLILTKPEDVMELQRYAHVSLFHMTVEESTLPAARAAFLQFAQRLVGMNLKGLLTRRYANVVEGDPGETWVFVDVDFGEAAEAVNGLQVHVVQLMRQFQDPGHIPQAQPWMSERQLASLANFGYHGVNPAERHFTIGRTASCTSLPDYILAPLQVNVGFRATHIALVLMGDYGQVNELLAPPVPI